MNIADLLSVDRVDCHGDATSKKRALEILSERLAAAVPGLTAGEIFDSLLARERLGSTGLGHGIAIPHGRLAGVDRAIAAFLKLREGIDYDAPDDQPVDLLFALIVPEACTDEHLQILATLAEMFGHEETVASLRRCESAEVLLELFSRWKASDVA